MAVKIYSYIFIYFIEFFYLDKIYLYEKIKHIKFYNLYFNSITQVITSKMFFKEKIQILRLI